MKIWRNRRSGDRRGIAAVEFAIACPVMLLFFAGLVDYGLALWDKSILSNAVAQGAYYAYVTGTNVTSSSVQSLVQNGTSLSNVTATVTSPACYCITGSPLALATATCNSTCTDTTTAGYFVTITAHYTYQSILPVYSHLNNPVLTEKTTVRLK
jgi:Flp pilus assembly protein TadG